MWNKKYTKTLFDKEDDIPDLLVKTLQEGKETIQTNGIKYEYDFGRRIGKTPAGAPLTKMRVILAYNKIIGKKQFITMYPIP